MTDASKATLIAISGQPLSQTQGYCYACHLPDGAAEGDDFDAPLRSRAILFEDGQALGPAHALHAAIGEQGGGRFSHWRQQIYFSASDNTSPLENGRQYHLYIPPPDEGDAEWAEITFAKAAPQKLPVQKRFDLARRAFRRIWDNTPLPDHGRRIEHDEDFAREFARLSPDSDVTAERKFNLDQLFRLTDAVSGDVAECGAYKGASAFFLARQIMQAGLSKSLLLFDSFQGLSAPDSVDATYWRQGDLASSASDIWQALAPLGTTPFVELYVGWIPERFPEIAHRRFCFVHIDVDLYQPTLDSMRFFYPRMNPGGLILLDDYGFASCPGVTKAVDEFMSGKPEPIVHLASGGAFVLKRERHR